MTRKTMAWWLMPSTIVRLKKKGVYGETQDKIINRILDENEEYEKKMTLKE